MLRKFLDFPFRESFGKQDKGQKIDSGLARFTSPIRSGEPITQIINAHAAHLGIFLFPFTQASLVQGNKKTPATFVAER